MLKKEKYESAELEIIRFDNDDTIENSYGTEEEGGSE